MAAERKIIIREKVDDNCNVKDIVVDESSQDETVRFVLTALKSLNSKLKRLEYVSPYKAHGIRRPQREIEDIKKTRLHDIEMTRIALDIFEGKSSSPIKFLRDEDGKILGFEIVNHKE